MDEEIRSTNEANVTERSSGETNVREFVERTPRRNVKKKASKAKRDYVMKNFGASVREFAMDVQKLALLAYAVCVLAAILAGVMLCGNSIVPVCIIVVIETLLAVCFHNLQVWFHGTVFVAEIICGICFGQVLFTVIIACLYLAAIFALQFVMRRE